ncbi:molybdenum cofactor biosynthesis protein MoaE [Aquimarina sp. BL5]|uniref:molybdenum cofactor biosynthesis protein MoaE n=1 Tax=Aquimarina sp. BL5 TaxID=1714860 RepID=UPI000E501DEE|nr:molybdenum cofactor biosynthesis protein MoaE [Aquimarina sp. BL5]AXT53583.1 molybdenum cofactor biosynthesis protein MoaE [Aquimarina sp. BL5]RKN02109.1 molybdenum cofactor biosynthesis protein MoaE [Aquimarina sp. BL5]
MNKRKTVFIEGPITPSFVANSIEKHQTKTTIGAHDIFLGQVRADKIDGKIVQAIDYSAYNEMAENKFHEIREATFNKYDLTCMHIYHSLGKVKAGEICLFVFVSAPHRKVAFEALEFLVEEIKKEVPVFGKEVFDDETHVWKVNKV